VDAAQRELSDQIDQATQRLLDAARVITEPDLRAPSLLPGWTRAHVVAHVARNAAMELAEPMRSWRQARNKVMAMVLPTAPSRT
jgi:uncharacterized protein (TIGR03083 family)